MKKFYFYFTLMSFTIFGLASCSDDSAEMDEMNSIENIEFSEKKSEEPSIFAIAGAAGFTKLAEAIQYVDSELGTGYEELFTNGTDQFTVFAPTNDAFDRLFETLDLKGIPVTPELVETVLLYHVTEGRRSANSVVPKNGSREITTLSSGATFNVWPGGMIEAVGSMAQIDVEGGLYNISANNGIIHVIDEVILPISLP